MNYKQRSKLRSTMASVLTVIFICISSLLGAFAVDLRVKADNPFHNIKSATTFLNDQYEIKNIDLDAAVGNLSIVYGGKPQIEVGSKIVDHAYFSFNNGTLIYRDDFEENELSFDDTNFEEYKVTITIPDNLEIDSLSVNVGLGSIDLRNIIAGHTKLNGTADILIDGFQGGTLDLNSTLADISAADISILKELNIRSYGSTAVISGNINGNVLIDSAGISNTNITFFNSDRANYFIKSRWEPESQNRDPGSFLLENGTVGISIDGEKYNTEYTDTNLKAPYKLTVISRELMPMDNITIRFEK